MAVNSLLIAEGSKELHSKSKPALDAPRQLLTPPETTGWTIKSSQNFCPTLVIYILNQTLVIYILYQTLVIYVLWEAELCVLLYFFCCGVYEIKAINFAFGYSKSCHKLMYMDLISRAISAKTHTGLSKRNGAKLRESFCLAAASHSRPRLAGA